MWEDDIKERNRQQQEQMKRLNLEQQQVSTLIMTPFKSAMPLVEWGAVKPYFVVFLLLSGRCYDAETSTIQLLLNWAFA